MSKRKSDDGGARLAAKRADSRRGTVCIIGIDFGTSRTGFAFAFTERPDVIICKEPGGQEATKGPSAILLDKDGKFLAFGHKAKQTYYETPGNHLLFQNYKMELWNRKETTGNPEAAALNGLKLPLLEVISATLKFVKDSAMLEINKSQLMDIKDEEIHWVITIPAIWHDIAKGFMRRAAVNAGIIPDESSDRLELALEPEAACVACESEQSTLKDGDTFMMLDCGGGTVDITIHRVAKKMPELQLDEIAAPSGGPYGSTFVDLCFEQFVKRFIGTQAFAKLKPSFGWMELMRAWENLKVDCDPSEDKEVRKAINFSPVLEVVDDTNLKALVDKYNADHGSRLGTRGKSTLLLPTPMIQDFFTATIAKITNIVAELLSEHDVKYIFLVGGFAESKLLLDRVKHRFEVDGRRVVVPTRAGLAVVKGAVMLGLGASSRFANRVARCTYGIRTYARHDPANPDHRGRATFVGVDKGESTVFVDGWVRPIVRKGDRIALHHEYSSNFGALENSGESCQFCIYVSTDPNAKWVGDPGMKCIGTVHVRARPGDELKLKLRFGTSEIRAAVVNTRTGATTPASIQYDLAGL